MRHFIFPGILVFSVLSSMAQDRAALNGTVTDPTGATVPGAQVQLRSPSTGLHRETVTPANGIYVLHRSQSASTRSR